jgi:hypothetical protein
MRNLRRVLWAALLLVVLVIAPQGALAQTGGEKKFPGGITLSGEWYAAWNAAKDPYLVNGVPFTNVIDSATGQKVLYTEKARFSQQADGSIVRDPLGSMLYTPGQPANFSLNTSACKVWKDNGYHICYAFLQTYISHGDMLGAPRSDPEEMNGRIVQAFEYGWLEWRPENPAGRHVVFMNLGRIAYKLWENKSGAEDSIIERQSPLIAYVFVDHPLITPGTEQSLAVIAYAPKNTSKESPIEGAIVRVNVVYQNGQVDGQSSQTTDADGIARFSFPVKSQELGEVVQVQVFVQSGSSSAQAGTSFRIWH